MREGPKALEKYFLRSCFGRASVDVMINLSLNMLSGVAIGEGSAGSCWTAGATTSSRSVVETLEKYKKSNESRYLSGIPTPTRLN